MLFCFVFLPTITTTKGLFYHVLNPLYFILNIPKTLWMHIKNCIFLCITVYSTSFFFFCYEVATKETWNAFIVLQPVFIINKCKPFWRVHLVETFYWMRHPLNKKLLPIGFFRKVCMTTHWFNFGTLSIYFYGKALCWP